MRGGTSSMIQDKRECKSAGQLDRVSKRGTIPRWQSFVSDWLRVMVSYRLTVRNKAAIRNWSWSKVVRI
jgi:hypothetical protein